MFTGFNSYPQTYAQTYPQVFIGSLGLRVTFIALELLGYDIICHVQKYNALQ